MRLSKSECTRGNLLCPFSFGMAIGVTKGLCLLLLAWAGHFWHYGLPIIHQVALFYHNYAPTIRGGLYGGLWGFIGGFIFGFVAALIYDLCLSCCCAKTTYCENKDSKR
ncbi:MAG TPA: hypothetical protein VLH77_02120 [Gammaproteobacteria bacterium]|nr:hypothetical protein [Gammaproteobacteria bacterium]